VAVGLAGVRDCPVWSRCARSARRALLRNGVLRDDGRVVGSADEFEEELAAVRGDVIADCGERRAQAAWQADRGERPRILRLPGTGGDTKHDHTNAEGADRGQPASVQHRPLSRPLFCTRRDEKRRSMW
jgi:hypothetical protein